MNVKLHHLDYVTEEGKLIVHARTNKYILSLVIYDTKVDVKSRIKVDCTCQSFKYEFAYAINFDDGLLLPDNYEMLTKKPKKRNIYNYPTGCKHLIKLGQMIYQKKNQIKWS
jgi:hypothetical protein